MTLRPVVIGAGPAGLTAAYELARRGLRPVVLEQADKVGGIARTETHNGYRFDLGGHRYFTKLQVVQHLWQQMLGPDLRKVARLSRIHYRGRFFHYPMDLFNTLANLGVLESLLIVSSYLRARLFPHREEQSIEEWVENRFGRRLYKTFFETYTEKVWGIPCRAIQADWAIQRIRGLSLRTAVLNAIFGGNDTRSLIKEFDYPVLGSGMMWERFADTVKELGGEVLLNTRVARIERDEHRVVKVMAEQDGKALQFPSDHVISSMALPDLIRSLDPVAPEPVRQAAGLLRFRAFVLVALVVDRAELFPDNWIYIHSPDVQVGRIQNYKNWSPAMVPDAKKTCLGMEYFCSEGDALWSLPDQDLVALASRELVTLRFAGPKDIEEGVVLRQPKAYPVYDRNYQRRLQVIREFVKTIPNLHTVGRNGLHRYNNMDHSMVTAIHAAENVAGAHHDLWEVDEHQDYSERQSGPSA